MNFSNERIVGKIIQIANDDILPNRFQPRKYFDEAETLELSESIKEHGILQPIVVRQVGDKYEIIAGERRYKANILAGNDNISAIVSNLNDKESSEIAIIENIQRQDLTPIEEAISYKHILDMGYITQEELARKIGKSQSTIANKIRLLKLSDNVQDALMEKKISERHARSLLQLDSLKDQDELLEKIINERLTVRKTDEEIKNMNNNEMINNQTMTDISNLTTAQNVDNTTITPQPVPVVESTINTNDQANNVNVAVPNVEVSPIMGTPVSNLNSNSIPNSNEVPVVNNQVSEEVQSTITETPAAPVYQQPATTDIPVVDQTSQTIPESPISQVTESNIPETSILDNVPVVEEQPTNTENPSANIFNQPIGNPQTAVTNSETDSGLNTPLNTQPIIEETPVSNIFNPTIENPINDDEQLNVNLTPIDTPTDNNSMEIPNNDTSLQSTFNIQDSINQINNSISDGQTAPKMEVEKNLSIDDSSVNLDQNTDIPSFIPEQTNEGSSPAVDLNQNSIEEVPNDDIPLNSTIESPVNDQPTPIIVTNNDTQYDPIMPEKDATGPTLDFKTIINLIRQCSSTIEKCGYKIDTEEYDLEGKYQVTFIIEK